MRLLVGAVLTALLLAPTWASAELPSGIDVARAINARDEGVTSQRAVKMDLIDRTGLVGPPGRIRERLSAWKSAEARGSLDMMLVTSQQPEALQLMAEELL